MPCFDQIKWAKPWFAWLLGQISLCKAIPFTFCFLSHTNTHTLVNTGEKKQAVPVQVNEFDIAYLVEKEISWKQSTLGQIQNSCAIFAQNCQHKLRSAQILWVHLHVTWFANSFSEPDTKACANKLRYQWAQFILIEFRLFIQHKQREIKFPCHCGGDNKCSGANQAEPENDHCATYRCRDLAHYFKKLSTFSADRWTVMCCHSYREHPRLVLTFISFLNTFRPELNHWTVLTTCS